MKVVELMGGPRDGEKVAVEDNQFFLILDSVSLDPRAVRDERDLVAEMMDSQRTGFYWQETVGGLEWGWIEV